MGLLHRRFPRYVRPYPFAVLAAFGAMAMWYGLRADVSLTRQTGNFFVLLTLPESLLRFEPLPTTLFVAGIVSWVVGFYFGTLSESSAMSQLRRRGRRIFPARFQFFPLTMLFGLFVLFFGILFLFDARMAADDSLGGLVFFVYLNYAGLLDRAFMTAVGLALTILGTWCATKGAFAPGFGIRNPRPAPFVARGPPPCFDVAHASLAPDNANQAQFRAAPSETVRPSTRDPLRATKLPPRSAGGRVAFTSSRP